MDVTKYIAPRKKVHCVHGDRYIECSIMAIFREKNAANGLPSVLLWRGQSKLEIGSEVFVGEIPSKGEEAEFSLRLGVIREATGLIGSGLSKLCAVIQLDETVAEMLSNNTETAELSKNVEVKVHSHNPMRVKMYPPAENRDDRRNYHVMQPSRRGSLVGQVYNVKLRLDEEVLTAEHLSVVRSTKRSKFATDEDGGSPVLSHKSRKLFGFVVAHGNDRDYVLNAEDVAENGHLEFLAQRRQDIGHEVWDFRLLED